MNDAANIYTGYDASAEASAKGGFYAVRVTERDHEKSAAEWEIDGQTADRGYTLFGPYASEGEADEEAARAKAYYDERKHVDEYGQVTWDWVVAVVPWPKGKTFSDYVREQEARKQGVPKEAVDLRAVFGETAPFVAGERSRPSGLAERVG